MDVNTIKTLSLPFFKYKEIIIMGSFDNTHFTLIDGKGNNVIINQYIDFHKPKEEWIDRLDKILLSFKLLK